jgi:hypothetical protein
MCQAVGIPALAPSMWCINILEYRMLQHTHLSCAACTWCLCTMWMDFLHLVELMPSHTSPHPL